MVLGKVFRITDTTTSFLIFKLRCGMESMLYGVFVYFSLLSLLMNISPSCIHIFVLIKPVQ